MQGRGKKVEDENEYEVVELNLDNEGKVEIVEVEAPSIFQKLFGNKNPAPKPESKKEDIEKRKKIIEMQGKELKYYETRKKQEIKERIKAQQKQLDYYQKRKEQEAEERMEIALDLVLTNDPALWIQRQIKNHPSSSASSSHPGKQRLFSSTEEKAKKEKTKISSEQQKQRELTEAMIYAPFYSQSRTSAEKLGRELSSKTEEKPKRGYCK